MALSRSIISGMVPSGSMYAPHSWRAVGAGSLVWVQTCANPPGPMSPPVIWPSRAT